MKVVNLPLTIKVFREGSSKEAPFVAYNPDLDVSSCGKTEDEAQRMLEKAVRLFLRGAVEDGTLNQILTESGLAPLRRDKEYPKTYFSILNFPLVFTSYRVGAIPPSVMPNSFRHLPRDFQIKDPETSSG